MGLKDKIPLKIPLLGKKKPSVPDQEIQVNITTKQHGKVVKEQSVSNKSQPIIKPNVFTDDTELESALRGGDGKRTFWEKPPKAGTQEHRKERYDRDRLNALLAMDVNPDKRQTFTVTPKEHNLIMVIGDTLNEVLAKGEERNLSDPNETVWGIFSKNRDLRAPSTWPEPGDNRNALIKAQEIMSQENEQSAFTKYGGG